MTIPNASIILMQAEEALNCGKSREAFNLLQPLINEKNPEALFLYAHLSISGTETEKEFDERRINILRNLCESGYSPSCHELAICYDIGDIVEKNPEYASILYKKSSEFGYSKSKLSHGLNLYYGSNGIKRDEKLGLELIRQAKSENVEGADVILSELENTHTS